MTLLDIILRVGVTRSVGVFLALWCGLRSAFDMVCLDQLEAGYFLVCHTYRRGKEFGCWCLEPPKGSRDAGVGSTNWLSRNAELAGWQL